MKCCRCPLYHYWSNESDRGEACAIFGDGWDSPFQYEDREGTIIGCYLDRHYIVKVDSERDEYYASMAESMARQLKTELTISKMEQVETMSCQECKHFHENAVMYLDQCDFCFKDCKYEPKDEPHTDCPWK